MVSLQPELCLHPRFPVSPHSYTPPHPPSPALPPSHLPWSPLPQRGGEGLTCLLCGPTDCACSGILTHPQLKCPPHWAILPFAVSFHTALDRGSEHLSLVLAHSFLSSSLPSANIYSVLTACEAPSRVPGMGKDFSERAAAALRSQWQIGTS